MIDLQQRQKIVLFDGVCNLCNHTVQFIIQHDKNDVFRFAALQSAVGQKLIKERHIDSAKIDSIILIVPGEAYYVKSSAALHIAKALPGYAWLRVFLHLPQGLRDFFYDVVAKNRYRWFGKKTKCMRPTPELQNKFLDA